MRKFLYALMGFLLAFSALKADDFLEEANETAPPAHLNHPMQDLNAIQGSFFDKNRSKMSNTLNIDYFQGQTYKIRLRYAMATLLFFSKPISDFVLGDKVGFDAKILESNDRILLIKPLQIGVDSNISVIDNEGKIFSFYVFSTTFTSSKHPNLQVFIEDKNYYSNAFLKPQNKENMAENAPKDAPTNNKPLKEEPLKEEKEETKEKEEETITIGDNTNAMKIIKKDIQKGYKALKSSQRKWYCLGICSKKSKLSLMPKEIFNDKQFTYFKFDKKLALSKFPVIYKVVDGYDNPVNTRIVGDYIIAEDVSAKWTLRLGKDYLCIRFVKKARDE